MTTRNYSDKNFLTRKLKRNGAFVNRGLFPSRKNKLPLYFESNLEYFGLLHFEQDPVILFIDTQPLSICIEVEDRPRDYSADFLIMTASGQIIYVEVKPSEKFETEKNKVKFDIIERSFQKLGRGFTKFTENDLSKIQISNLERLWNGASVFGDMDVDVTDAIHLLGKDNSISDSLQILKSNDIVPEMLHYLLFNHYFSIDFGINITPDTVIHRNVF